MKKFFALLSIAALAIASVACDPDEKEEAQLPSAAGITPVVVVEGNVATFSLPAGTTGLIPVWETNESGNFVFAGRGDGFQKTFFTAGTYKVRMYVSNSVGQSKDYSEAEFTVEGAGEWSGYNYDSEFNIWKPAEAAGMDDTYTYYNPGWAAEKTLNFTTNPYKLSIADVCNDKWQCQLHLVPGAEVALSAEKHYDFSCLVKLNKSVGMTVKVVQQGNDDLFLFDQIEDTPAGDNIFYMKDVPGIDATAIKIVFDFGYCEAGTEVEITRITLKDHADNDGTNAPDKEKPVEPEPEPEPEGDYPAANFAWAVDGAANLWKAVAEGNGESYYYYASDGDAWGGVYGDTLADEVPFMVKNNNSYALTYEKGTGANIWYNQFFIYPKAGSFVALDAAKKYALQIKLSATADTPAFFKLEQYNAEHAKREGATIWEKGEFTITAGEDYVVTSKIIKDVACDNINLVFAFGGAQAGTTVTIKDICLQEYNL